MQFGHVLLGILHRDALGELDFHLVRGDIEFVRDRHQAFGQVGALELFGGDVHGHRYGFEAGALPGGDLPGDVAEHTLAEFDDEIRGFGDLDEGQRRHRAMARIVPARQGFERHQAAAADIDDRLQVNLDGVAVHGAAQILLERQARMHALVHGRIEHLHVVAAARFRFVQRDVGRTQQLAHGRGVARIDGKTNAGRGGVGGFAESHRLLTQRRRARRSRRSPVRGRSGASPPGIRRRPCARPDRGWRWNRAGGARRCVDSRRRSNGRANR